jgi:thiol-disulfide isomerase/thioredoxin
MRILGIGIFLMIIPCIFAGEKQIGFKVNLRNNQVLNVIEVGFEKNMLVFQQADGQVTAVSRDLVDWYQVFHRFPALFDMYCPESTRKSVLLRLKKENLHHVRQHKARKEIVLTSSDLKKMSRYKYHDLFSERAFSANSTPEKKADRVKIDGRKIISIISHGEEVTLSQHLEKGRYVIFDFFASWCGPCRKLGPKLEKLVSDFPGHVALKKIDIKKWGTPVATKYGIRSIPFVIVYGPDGEKVGGVGAHNLNSFIRGRAREEQW